MLWAKTFDCEKKMFLDFFQLLSVELSYFGDESPTGCQNCVLSKGTFSRRSFLFWKKTDSLILCLRIWEELLKEIIKMEFWRKNISTVVTTGFHGSRGNLCGIYFSGKESFAKTFLQLERKFVMFFPKLPGHSWNVHHCVQINLLGENMFFEEK